MHADADDYDDYDGDDGGDDDDDDEEEEEDDDDDCDDQGFFFDLDEDHVGLYFGICWAPSVSETMAPKKRPAACKRPAAAAAPARDANVYPLSVSR